MDLYSCLDVTERAEQCFAIVVHTLCSNGSFFKRSHCYHAEIFSFDKRVMVEEKINGKTETTHEGILLRYKEITERPQKEQNKPLDFGLTLIEQAASDSVGQTVELNIY